MFFFVFSENIGFRKFGEKQHWSNMAGWKILELNGSPIIGKSPIFHSVSYFQHAMFVRALTTVRNLATALSLGREMGAANDGRMRTVKRSLFQ